VTSEHPLKDHSDKPTI